MVGIRYLIFGFAFTLMVFGGEHPSLFWTKASIERIKQQLGKQTLFDQALEEARQTLAVALRQPIAVPVPKDAAGYTHERHKQNYREMYFAGLLYQLTGEVRYFQFVKEQLEKYAELYPKLGKHPAGTSHSPGRIFWQSLNEAVWLVHVSQAYDCIQPTLGQAERARLEDSLFRPMARFFLEERVHEFDRIHNHGTWTAAAVGLLGYAMGDQDLVDKALYGSKKNGEAGFLRQIDLLFSPDGLYCEGPYYGRYALMPFFLFARVIENRQPELRVFERREGLLTKAFYSQLQLSYTNGAFLPYNDALKEKSYRSPEILMALAEVYAQQGRDKTLLDIARRQGAVALSPAGFELAQALGKADAGATFPYASVEYRDGAEGKSGGLGVLRWGGFEDQMLLCFKYGVHGMEHGHFDKLSFMLYDQGQELLPDYGSARFLNVEQKTGGRYLPENRSWAMQTLAHNTVVVDGASQFQGDYNASEASHSERHFFLVEDKDFQVVSAREDKAYPGVSMLRTLALLKDRRLSRPLLVDIYRLGSKTVHDYDYFIHYKGVFLAATPEIKARTQERVPLGKTQGYQHLWLAGEGETQAEQAFTWMLGDRYYTLHLAEGGATRTLMTELGAADPRFNLRRESSLVLRRRSTSTVFAVAIEPHGFWDGNKEVTRGCFPKLRKVRVLATTPEATVVRIEAEDAMEWTLMLSASDAGKQTKHRVETPEGIFEWSGPAALR